MASHAGSKHTKRISAPRSMPVKRKSSFWLVSTRPGAHAKENAVPLLVVVRDMLQLAATEREAKKLINGGQIYIDGRAVKAKPLPVGVMDLVHVPKLEKTWVVLLNQSGKLACIPTKQKHKLCKVTGKRFIAGGKVQLSLHDGRTLLADKSLAAKTGDTLQLDVPSQKVSGVISLEKGARCYVAHGRHAGSIGTLEEIIEFKGITRPNVRLKTTDGELITLKEYVFAVDSAFSTK